MAKKSFLERFRKDDEIISDVVEVEGLTPVEKKTPQAPSERGGINPGQIVLIAFVVVLLFGTLLALTGVIVLKPAPAANEVAEVPDYTIKTAREAYPAAVETIRAEDTGARLASAVGLWTPGTPAINLQSGRSGWTFYFYMPATSEMATVVVDQDGITHIEDQTAWAVEPELLDDTRWQQDSPQMIALYLDRCGDKLATVGDAAVEARLTTALGIGQVLWQVSFTSESSPEAACVVTIDALTGLVR